jgi:hypothetical protein
MLAKNYELRFRRIHREGIVIEENVRARWHSTGQSRTCGSKRINNPLKRKENTDHGTSRVSA